MIETNQEVGQMNMYEELKAWADKWGIPYTETLADDKRAVNTLVFDSVTDLPAEFHYNPNTGEYNWFGGD
jgi:hypothetical protein